MRFPVLTGLVLLLGTMAIAAPVPSKAQAVALEAKVRANPADKAARLALLQYYFAAAEVSAARRTHLLWLIQNAPEDPGLMGPWATIDAAGHALADPDGYRQASALWRVQAAKPDAAAAVLVNAGFFFKLADHARAIDLLERAVAREPANKEYGGQLGDAYAIAALGITMVNRNRFPQQADPALAKSPAALHAREALEKTCSSPYALVKAGYMLAWQGAILAQQKKVDFDPRPLARAAAERGVKLAPNDAEVARYLAEINKLPGGQPAAAPVIEVDVAKNVAVGMNRDEVLKKLGQPSGRITSNDRDGKLTESMQYYGAKGKWLGTVRLVEGVVTTVELP